MLACRRCLVVGWPARMRRYWPLIGGLAIGQWRRHHRIWIHPSLILISVLFTGHFVPLYVNCRDGSGVDHRPELGPRRRVLGDVTRAHESPAVMLRCRRSPGDVSKKRGILTSNTHPSGFDSIMPKTLAPQESTGSCITRT